MGLYLGSPDSPLHRIVVHDVLAVVLGTSVASTMVAFLYFFFPLYVFTIIMFVVLLCCM